ncbi:SprT-like domain-containing protein [Trueperella pyogenes]|uniref:SprT-like domain-containing protein n=1 Tax=Trueperella pyogenes TaxID=1661 RepID=UPI00345DBEC6
MNLTEAHLLARALMDDHGLAGWTLVMDRAKRRAGFTSHARKTISFSRPLLELYTPEQVRLLVLHEVAHALVGEGHGHDAVWRSMCLTIGGDGRASVDPGWPEPTALWIGLCPNGHRIERQRLVRRRSTCRCCSANYDERYLISWTNQRTGEIFR